MRRAAFLVMASGVLAGVAASTGAGPFSGLRNTGHHAMAAQVGHYSPLTASDLYPSPSAPTPVVQTIVVQDPPLPAPVPEETEPAASPSEDPEATEQPQPTEHCDDGCSGGAGTQTPETDD